MRSHELPRVILEGGFRRLAAVFDGGKTPDLEGWIWAVGNGTHGWTEAEYAMAVKRCAIGQRYFPRPAALIGERPGTNADHVVTSLDSRICPACHGHYFYAGYRTGSGIVMPKIRCQCPHPGRGWSDPEALAWRETDPGLIRAGYVGATDDDDDMGSQP